MPCLQVRTLVQRELHAALEQYDCLLSPVAPTAAFQLGEKSSDPLTMYRSDIMTTTLNLAGKLWLSWAVVPVMITTPAVAVQHIRHHLVRPGESCFRSLTLAFWSLRL